MQKYTLTDFNQQFPDEDAALDWLRYKLYPEKIYCPKCDKATKHHRITSRKVYGCDYCGHQISPTAGTLFHKSPTPLRIWLYVVFQMAQTRGGISAKQIERETGVTYKTAWRMCNEIRKRLGEGQSLFRGDVEIDESYFGGKKKGGKRGRGAEGKTPVVGMVQRKGQIKAVAVADVKSETINTLVKETIEPGTMVHTDEFSVYNKLERMGYEHRRIAHSAKIYVVGDVHTNTIEGFWALVKNGIVGVFHSVSEKYLQCYLDEYTFRYNHRNDNSPMFLTMLNNIAFND
jgi:transposase-like protein